MNSRFRELWNDTHNMLSFEIKRLNMELTHIDKQIVLDYYRERIVGGLWYSRTFVSDYNSWLWENVTEEKKRNEIRNVMKSFDPPSNSLLAVYAGLCVSVILAITGITLLRFLHSVALGVILLLACVAFLIGIYFMYKRNKGKTNIGAIQMELDRICNNIEQMI